MPDWKPSWIFFRLLPLCLTANSMATPARVIEDVPGRLRLMLCPTGMRIETGHADADPSTHPPVTQAGEGPIKVACDACGSESRPGAPQLPVHRFEVACGAGIPQIAFRILESETRSVPQGVSPVGRYLSPTRAEYRVDAARYREAASLAAVISDPQSLRGVPIRSVEIPLCLWDEHARSLTLIKRLEVEVIFPAARTHPSAYWPDLVDRAVANPAGGRYLSVPPARIAVLRKAAAGRAAPASSLPGEPPGLGENWIRIKVGDRSVETQDEDRVYAITGKELFQASKEFRGARLDSLRLFAGPNDTLPARMGFSPVAGTLHQVGIQVLDKSGNSILDDDDEIRFYGHGTSLWRRTAGDSGLIKWRYAVDPYSFENYYFLSYQAKDAAPPLRWPNPVGLPPAAQPIGSGYHFLRAEQDAQSPFCDLSSPPRKDEEGGFEWSWFWLGGCGDKLVTSLKGKDLVRKDMETLEDWASDGSDSLFIGLFQYPATSSDAFKVHYAGGGPLPFLTGESDQGSYYVQAGPVPGKPALSLDSVVLSSGQNFDAMTVAYRRNFIYHGRPLWIFPAAFGRRVGYRVAGGAGLACVRIEGGELQRRITVEEIGNGDGIFTDSLGALSDGRYLLYPETSPLPAGSATAEALPAPKSALRDLAGGEGNPEYLIITSRELLPAAIALRDYRNQEGRVVKARTAVALVEDVYRQFSGGRATPVAIRDFLRWAYNDWGRGGPGSGALKYALLFGDGHYDLRGIKASLLKDPPANIIPPFEYYPFLSGSGGIASDDFYGLLDSTDDMTSRAAPDVAIGRLPVQNETQALGYLRKVQAYESPAKAGEWRGRIVMAADDNLQLDRVDKMDHTNYTEELIGTISGNEPGISVDKVYLLDYPINAAHLKPEASQDLLTLMNRGAALVNFIGHGSMSQWADEVLLKTTDALSRMHNEGRTPMINAFSCTVGRFEALSGEGMSEQFVKHPDVGAIAAISATRESFSDANMALAKDFADRAFPGSAAPFATVGEALALAKTNSYDPVNNRRYALLGEPVLLLRKPQLRVAFTQAPDTLQALDCRSLKGTIAGGTGEGQVNVKIVAGSIRKDYLTKSPGGETYAQSAEKRGNILFERTVAYHNHEFSMDYFIPKQISFGDTNAQILAFAWDKTMEMEGASAKLRLHIKGTAKSACAADDGRGPRIRVTGCDTTESGGLDFPDQVRLPLPYCLRIQVEDPSGGVMSAEGPDEGTTLEIPGSLEPFHPQPGVDELARKSYQLTLDARTLRPGPHLLKVSARDGYGNISRRQLRMDLTRDSSLSALMAYNVPNPMKGGVTRFYFGMGIPAADAEVIEGATRAPENRLGYEIRIFDQRGFLVRTFRKATSGETAWDGTDEWGNRMANGVYFYKVIARQNLSLLDDPNPGYSTKASKRNVLVISR